MVLVPATAAYADRAHHAIFALQRHAAGKSHDAAVVGHLDAEKLLARLRVRPQILGRQIEGAAGKRLVEAISTLPILAPSMRAWATKLPPASTTAIFSGWPISWDFSMPAAMTRWASSSETLLG